MTSAMGKGITRLTVFFVIALTAGFVQAQRTPEQMRQRFETQNKETIEQLALSEEQTPLVTKILDEGLEARMKLMESRTGGGGNQGIREEMIILNEETTKKLSEVLTDVQMTKYKEIQESRQRRRRNG